MTRFFMDAHEWFAAPPAEVHVPSPFEQLPRI
jgi:hypothetical protein